MVPKITVAMEAPAVQHDAHHWHAKQSRDKRPVLLRWRNNTTDHSSKCAESGRALLIFFVHAIYFLYRGDFRAKLVEG